MNQNYNFDFCCPTKIYFRDGGVSEIGNIIKEDYHFNRVYLVYGGHSLKNNGTYDKIVESLNTNHISFAEYSGIQANPDVSDVIEMVKQAREFKPDIILAVGGGSVLDASKSLAHSYYYDGNPLDFNKHLVTPLHALPIATIITLSASGSEMSDSCVISDRKHHFKGGFNIVSNYPLFSLMDPTLTLSVPPYQVGIGLADMFSHSMERYFSPSHDLEPCDELALGIMKSIVDASKVVIKEPNNIEGRRAMMIAGALAHDGFTSFGKNRLFIVHKAEHRLSGFYPELAHGQGIALLLAEYLEINKALFNDKLICFGQVAFSLDRSCKAEDSISALRQWIDSLPIYHSFEELPFEIKNEDIEKARKTLVIGNK